MGLAEQASDLELGSTPQNDGELSVSSGDPTIDQSQSSDDESTPPVWIPLKEEVDEIIKDVTDKMRTMRELERKRLGNVFGSDKQEGEIEHIQYSITEQIREAEDKLRSISNYESRSHVDEKIKQNVQCTLAKRLQELAGAMRKEQRSYLTKVQEIHGVTLEDQHEEELYDDLTLTQEQSESRHKNKEIENLVQRMNDLATLFKELNTLVIEQGTIVDRIDYNLEQAVTKTKTGRVHLEGALRHQQKSRARSCMCLLLVLIVIFGAIYVLKKA